MNLLDVGWMGAQFLTNLVRQLIINCMFYFNRVVFFFQEEFYSLVFFLYFRMVFCLSLAYVEEIHRA